MRRNLPVTGRERTFPASLRLISATTRKGVITYVNDDFCQVAGYSREQLIGQAHNLIRHPDVPPAVFEDFWSTLKAGRPWLGIVKNRCSNGDHYWVSAYVSPMYEGGEHVGFQSVRTQPTQEQIARAEKLYSRVWKQRRLPRGGLRLATGIPVGLGLTALSGAALGHWIASPAGVALGAAVLTAVAVLVGMVGVRRLQRVERHARDLFDNPLGACMYGGGRDEPAYLAYALEMESARAGTILGRVDDMSQRLLAQAQALETVTLGTRQAIDGQRQEVEQVTMAMSQMAAATHQVAASTARAADAASGAVEQSTNGTEVLGRSTAAMANLAREVEQGAGVIERVQRDSEMIRGVLDVIGGISEQTNLLALNAAIEAARAGASGRGFAVVADEVRTLAQRSSKSTDEIRGMIDRLQSGTDAATAAMRHSRDAAAQVGESAAEAERAIGDMNDAIVTIREMGTEIASAAEEQSATGDEISRNLERVNTNIADTADAALRARQASEELLAVVDGLQGMLRQFGQNRSG